MADETTQQQENSRPEEKQLAISPQPRYPMREMLTILKDTGNAELFQAFARDIIERELASARFGQDHQLARVFAASGAFDKINGSEQGVALAMTKIQLGRSWNMEIADAMKSVFFINGRPSVESVYLAAQMQNSGLNWDIGWDEDEKGRCTGCHLYLKRWNPDSKTFEPVMSRVNGVEKQAYVSFTKKDADMAMVYENGKTIRLSDKFNYQSWPSDMYYSRCVSRVRNRYAPNILSGFMTREEAEDAGDSNASSNGLSASASPGSGRAAIASASKIEEIGDRLEKSRTKAEVKETSAADTATTEEKSNVTTMPSQGEKSPWKNRIEMQKAMSAMTGPVDMGGIGKMEFDRILAKHGQEWAKMAWDSAEALACYREMEALRKEERKPEPAAEPVEKPLF